MSGAGRVGSADGVADGAVRVGAGPGSSAVPLGVGDALPGDGDDDGEGRLVDDARDSPSSLPSPSRTLASAAVIGSARGAS
ncbi:hypothetical protein STENM327S_04142 [Streptomyces tendae]